MSTRHWNWFNLGRSEKLPAQYGEQHVPAHWDVLTAGLILGWTIAALSFLAILPAYGKHKRRTLLLRILISIITGGIVLVCNYGHNWEIATANIITPYKPYTHEEIKGTIGLHITLRGVNITLKGEPLKHHGNEKSSLEHERIDYNENFSWEWAQGRLGFGYYAGQISKDFRAAAQRGVPLPILAIAEYFTFDGEGIRFGRYYRLAGWYSHIFMWAGFVTWILSNILFCMIISTATYFLIITGFLQLAAIGVWTYLRNPTEIQIPFQSAENPAKDILLKTSFGPDYYLVLGNGGFCIVLGLILLILNSLYPDEMCNFFGIDPLTIYDELLLSKEELETVKKENDEGDNEDIIELGPMVSSSPQSDGSDRPGSSKKVSFHGDRDGERPESETLVLKRRTNVGSRMFRKSFVGKPKPKPRRQNQYFEEYATQKPLLSHSRGAAGYGSSDEESNFSWPPPPRESVLKAPPTPPVKPKIRWN